MAGTIMVYLRTWPNTMYTNIAVYILGDFAERTDVYSKLKSIEIGGRESSRCSNIWQRNGHFCLLAPAFIPGSLKRKKVPFWWEFITKFANIEGKFFMGRVFRRRSFFISPRRAHAYLLPYIFDTKRSVVYGSKWIFLPHTATHKFRNEYKAFD